MRVNSDFFCRFDFFLIADLRTPTPSSGTAGSLLSYRRLFDKCGGRPEK
jgi:hypothetical protein